MSEALKVPYKVTVIEANLDEVKKRQVERDLVGLPGYETFLRESVHTIEWTCRKCGQGPNPCAVSTCVQCGYVRPRDNYDPDLEGSMGRLRKRAKAR